MSFLLIKYVHIVCVATSFALLFIRGVWLLRSYPPAHESWVRALPRVVDALLVLSGCAMFYIYPGVTAGGDWFGAKLGFIAAYAGLVFYLSRMASTVLARGVTWILAMVTFLFVASVAVLHSPKGWVLLL